MHLDLRLPADAPANLLRSADWSGVPASGWSWVLIEDHDQLRVTVQVRFVGDDLAGWCAAGIAGGATGWVCGERWVEVLDLGGVTLGMILLITIYEKVEHTRTEDEIVAEEQVQQWWFEGLQFCLKRYWLKKMDEKEKEKNFENFEVLFCWYQSHIVSLLLVCS
jgi:hypothetical protein